MNDSDSSDSDDRGGMTPVREHAGILNSGAVSSYKQIVTGDHNTLIQKFSQVNIINQPTHRLEFSTDSKLTSVVENYKKFITEENSTIRNKLNQLQVNGKTCYVERKYRSIEGDENSSLTTTELLASLPSPRTSLVSAPSGSGKSTVAANMIKQWAKSADSGYEIVLYLSSKHSTRMSELSKLVWGSFASRLREDSKLIYQELEHLKEKILVIIDGLGKYDFEKKI